MSSKALKLLMKEKESSIKQDDTIENFDDILDSRNIKDNLFQMLSIEEEYDFGTNLNNELHERPKKKKNKKKTRQTPLSASIDENNLLDKYIQENSITEKSSKTENAASRSRTLLQVDYRCLDPENELIRCFGSIAIRNDKRKNILSKRLIKPKKEWTALLKSGLSMRIINKNDFESKFVFEHSNSYRDIQFAFLDAVESSNPQEIMKIHKENPNHIDTMLQLCDICCTHENWEMATELIERCLYVFEQSFHTSFNCTLRNILLPYKYKENRSFYVSLFRHMTFLGRRGCCRTALEFSKLILNLDPQDPLAVLLVIDFYALRSNEFDFLINLANELHDQKNVHLLPNFAFSVALAHFKINLLEKSDELIQDALIMFPSFLPMLLDKCSIKPDDAVSGHKFLTTRPYRDTESLKMLIQLYVHRNYVCWKEASVLAWLEKNAKLVLRRVDSEEPYIHDIEIKNKLRFIKPPLNVCRHIILSGVKGATISLPPELTSTTILSYDPLPPNDSVSSYVRPPRQANANQNDSWLSLFFESILPSYNVRRAAENRNMEGAQRGNFMEIIRELQANIEFVHPVPQNQQPDEEEEEELLWPD